MDKLKVGVIGLRGHAGRHIQMLQENPNVRLSKVYYHRPPPTGYDQLPITDDITDCLDTDVIIISSPTPQHAQQLELFRDYPGYILLEKPAASSRAEIDQLLRLSPDFKSRIQVNFNFRYHDVSEQLSKVISSPSLGRIFAIDFHSSHGGAFRDDWQESWRLGVNSGFGPLETVGVHFIHFALCHFGRCDKSVAQMNSISPVQGSRDTGTLTMAMENGTWVNIRNSYAAPYGVFMNIWGTNGYVNYDGQTLRLHSPRDTFDEHGLFTNPPEVGNWQINHSAAWKESLVRSQHHLLENARGKTRFDPAQFDRDVSVMNVLLDAQTSVWGETDGPIKS